MNESVKLTLIWIIALIMNIVSYYSALRTENLLLWILAILGTITLIPVGIIVFVSILVELKMIKND